MNGMVLNFQKYDLVIIPGFCDFQSCRGRQGRIQWRPKLWRLQGPYHGPTIGVWFGLFKCWHGVSTLNTRYITKKGSFFRHFWILCIRLREIRNSFCIHSEPWIYGSFWLSQSTHESTLPMSYIGTLGLGHNYPILHDVQSHRSVSIHHPIQLFSVS